MAEGLHPGPTERKVFLATAAGHQTQVQGCTARQYRLVQCSAEYFSKVQDSSVLYCIVQ